MGMLRDAFIYGILCEHVVPLFLFLNFGRVGLLCLRPNGKT